MSDNSIMNASREAGLGDPPTTHCSTTDNPTREGHQQDSYSEIIQQNSPKLESNKSTKRQTDASGSSNSPKTPPSVAGEATVDSSSESAESDDSEDDMYVSKSLRRTLFGSVSVKDVLQKERRLGILDRRSQQAALDHSLTFARLGELEKEMKVLKQAVYQLEDDWKPPPNTKWAENQRTIRRVAWDQFRATQATSAVPSTEQPALEVLVSEQSIMEGDSGLSQPMHLRRCPERLRIRSRSLLWVLNKFIDSSVPLSASSHTMGDEGGLHRLYSCVLSNTLSRIDRLSKKPSKTKKKRCRGKPHKIPVHQRSGAFKSET